MAEIKEDTHLVLKMADISRFLDSKEDLDSFIHCLELIHEGLEKEGRSHRYMVCNWDEPYAHKVFQEILNGEEERNICNSKITKSIIKELCKTCEKLGAKSDLLSILGSYGDTLSDDEVLEILKKYNS